MSKSTLNQVALVALLVGAGLIGHQVSNSTRVIPNWTILGLVLFGVINVFFSAPGTQWVRTIALVLTGATLLWPFPFLLFVPIFAWLVWPPVFMLAWGFAGKSAAGIERQEDNLSGARARIALAALIGAVALGSLAYRLLVGQGLQQSAALFVGIPALLAIVVVFAVEPRSATGVACKAVTVGLLVSLLLLGEGVLCVLMSAPLFYGIAVALAAAIDYSRRRRERSGTSPTLMSCLMVLAILPMSLEGVASFTTLEREESVTVSKIVHGSSEAVQRALFELPRFDRTRPRYLRAGFPRPLATRIEQRSGLTRWIVQIRGGEMRLNGMEPRTGDLIMELEEARPGVVRWRAVSDTSHVTHFLTWREAVVRWEPVDAETTRVTWTLQYRRGLDPSWYFGPMERYAARLAAGYLIDSVATP